LKRLAAAIALVLPWVACAHRGASGAQPVAGSALGPAWTVAIDAASGTQLAPISGGFLAATPAGIVIRINAEDGVETWRRDLGAAIAGPLAVAPAAAGSIDALAAVPLEGGRVAVFSQRTGVEGVSPNPGWGEMTLVAARDGVVALSKEGLVRRYRADSPDPSWERRLPAPPSAPGAICAGRFLVGLEDGRIVGVDLETGEIRTRKDLGSPAAVAPTCSDRTAWVATTDNTVHALRLHARRAGETWKVRSGADPAAAPLLFRENLLFLSKDTFLYGFRRNNGHLLFRLRLDRRPGPGAILDNLLFVAGPQSTRLDAFRLPDGHPAGSYILPEAARFITPPVASNGRVAIVVGRYGEETSRLVGLASAIAGPSK